MGARMKLLVALVVVAGIGLGVYLLQGQKSQGAAGNLASGFPEDAMILVWTRTLDDMLGFAADAHLTTKMFTNVEPDLGRLVALLGIDPLNPEDLRRVGFDTSASLGAALFSHSPELLLLAVFLPGGEEGKLLGTTKDVIAKLGDRAPGVEETEVKGHRVLWLVRSRPEPTKLNELACEHAIDLMTQEMKKSGSDSFGTRDSYIRDCVRSLNEEAEGNWEQMALCILNTRSVEDFQQCEPRKLGGKVFQAPDDLRGQKRFLAGLVEVKGGVFVVLPLSLKRGQQEEEQAGLQALVDKLTDDQGKKLASVEGFGRVTEGSQGSSVGFYLNPVSSYAAVSKIPYWGPVFSGLEQLDGMAAWLKLEADGYTMISRSLIKEGPYRKLLRTRDDKVLQLIPQGAVAGIHLAVDAEQWQKEIEKGLAAEPSLWRDYQRARKELQEEGLPPGLELYQLWNGEAGVFLGAVSPPNPEYLAKTVVGFLGIADQTVVTGLLEGFTKGLGSSLASSRTTGDLTIWQFNAGPLSPGVMIRDGYLWFAGDCSLLDKIAAGPSGGLFEGERAKQLTEVLRTRGALAGFLDLKELVKSLSSTLSKRELREAEPFWLLIEKLNLLSISNVVEDGMYTTTTRILVDTTDLRGLITGLISTLGDQRNLGVNSRARTEAVDMLDKIYKGATNYYSTPRVEYLTGARLPCQFPVPQGPTPAQTCCGSQGGPDRDGDGRCDPEGDAWDTPTWSALMFGMWDPHYCVYSFETNSKTGPDAEFTATALCDIDCNGVYSTFQRSGKGDEDSSFGECTVKGGAALYMNNENE